MPRPGLPANVLVCVLAPAFAMQVEAQILGRHAAEFWDELKTVIDRGQAKRLRVEFENDVFYATDRNYTNAVRLTWRAGADQAVKFDDDDQSPWIPPTRFTAGSDEARRARDDRECAQAARNLEERASGLPSCYRTVYNFVFFGHNLYTPSDISLSPARIPAGERPYAAWAYVGFHRELHASDGRYWRYGVDIGCIGPCAHGRQLQTWVHDHVTHSPLPQGWESQVRNEFGAVVRFEYARSLWHTTLAPMGERVFGLPLATDLRPHVNAGVGNLQTYAGVGLTARLGWFRTSYDSLRLDTHALESLADARRNRYAMADAVDVGTTRADCDGQCAPARTLTRPPELFGFARLHGDLVAYNAMLQGGIFNRADRDIATARPVLFEHEIGIGGAIGEFSILLSTVARRQWDLHGGRYGQRFGRLSVEFSTWF